MEDTDNLTHNKLGSLIQWQIYPLKYLIQFLIQRNLVLVKQKLSQSMKSELYRQPTRQGTKYVGEAPDFVFGGPGLKFLSFHLDEL